MTGRGWRGARGCRSEVGPERRPRRAKESPPVGPRPRGHPAGRAYVPAGTAFQGSQVPPPPQRAQAPGPPPGPHTAVLTRSLLPQSFETKTPGATARGHSGPLPPGARRRREARRTRSGNSRLPGAGCGGWVIHLSSTGLMSFRKSRHIPGDTQIPGVSCKLQGSTGKMHDSPWLRGAPWRVVVVTTRVATRLLVLGAGAA